MNDDRPKQHFPNFDSQLDQFDAAWESGKPLAIDQFLEAVPEDDRRQFLVELVKIDLERRWRSKFKELAANNSAVPARPLLEDYVRLYSQIGRASDLPLDLIAEEYRVRQRWGDRPESENCRASHVPIRLFPPKDHGSGLPFARTRQPHFDAAIGGSPLLGNIGFRFDRAGKDVLSTDGDDRIESSNAGNQQLAKQHR